MKLRTLAACIGAGAILLLAACASDNEATTAEPTATEAETTATEARTPAPTKTESPTPIDPDAAYLIWLKTFEDASDELLDPLADDFAQRAYWIDSVDRATYDKETNLLTVDATISFESTYMREPQEWRDDTWRLYSEYARIAWGAYVESFEAEAEAVDLPLDFDWLRWTPGLRLNGNVGRLTVHCPGTLIYQVQQRDATQAEFQTECTFTP